MPSGFQGREKRERRFPRGNFDGKRAGEYTKIVMKKYALLILLGFGVVAIFGFLWMGCDMNGCGRICLAKLAQYNTCPPENATGLAIYHSSAFQGFSLAILAILALMVFLVTAISFGVYPLIERFRYVAQEIRNTFSVRNQHFIDWLVLHEKRDPAGI